MDLTNIQLDQPIEPYINADGWFAQCERCFHEIEPTDNICPYCFQLQDWSWLRLKTERSNKDEQT